MAVAIEFGAQTSGVTTSSTITFSAMDFNAEASDRIIAVSIGLEDTSDTVASVTIGGETAAEKKAESGNTSRQFFWAAAVPTGTSGDVVVTLTPGDSRVSVATFSITGADATPTDTDSATGSGADISITALTIPTDGAGICGSVNGSAGVAISWTGASVSHDTSVTAFRHSSAIVTTVGTNTITADGATAVQSLVGVAWGPASGATTYTADLDPASFAYTPSSLGVVTKRPATLSPTSLAFTPQSLSVSTKRVVTLSPASFAYAANDLTADVIQAITYSIELLPASFSYTPSALEVSATGQGVTTLGPGWGERTYRLEWRDRKWVKRKEREDELSNLIRQVYARLSGETETAEAEAVETAAAEVVEVLAPYTVEESIDWEGLEANARAIADLEDALEAYIKARDEEEDWLLMVAA